MLMKTSLEFDNGKVRLWSYKGIPVVEPYVEAELDIEDVQWIAQLGAEHFNTPQLIIKKSMPYSITPDAQVLLMEVSTAAEKCAFVVTDQAHLEFARLYSETHWETAQTEIFFDMEQAYQWVINDAPSAS
jgi:hypothetical protein